jgi:transposase, IS5 family
MRHAENPQTGFGQIPVSNIEIDLQSRDDIPKILLGLKQVHQDEARRQAILNLIAKDFAVGGSLDNGAPGMDLWQVFVLGAFRLGLNCDYDRLTELANEHRTLRQMLGHGVFDDAKTYAARTLGENLSRLRPETLQLINWVIVGAAHDVLGVDAETTLHTRCDSSVVKTDVHFPTDANLLLDAIRKILHLGGRAAQNLPEITGWREYRAHYRKFKRLYRHASKIKRSTSKDEVKKQAQKERTKEAFLALLTQAAVQIEKAEALLPQLPPLQAALAEEIEYFIFHARRQSDQIRARVIRGEDIPHSEKVFSLFEPHTEWVVKGKAGVPVELGVRAAFVEDQHGLILNHRVMHRQTDDKITVSLIQETRVLFPNLRSASFDKGFYTPENRNALDRLLDQVTLPKKGRRNEEDQERETTIAFLNARKQHAAVESAIHALQVHGLSHCRDHGKEGFSRYIGWGVVAFNLHRLGAILQEQERQQERRRQRQAA